VSEIWDAIIVGAGPGGLTAGLYCSRFGLKTVIFESATIGGQATEAPYVENYPGFELISGFELTQKMYKQAEKAGVQIKFPETVTKLELKEKIKKVTTDSGEYKARLVILAMGAHHRELGVVGEREFKGRGVSYCAVCDGMFFKGKRVAVIGGGNSALDAAAYLSALAQKTYLIHRRDEFRAEWASQQRLKNSKVELLLSSELKAIKGDRVVRQIELFNKKTSQTTTIELDGVFILIGTIPNSEVAKKAGVAVDENGYVIVDLEKRTNFEGVYAIGDVTATSVEQIAGAVGDAVVAAINGYNYLQKQF
jgi:thioredoxin reductase (NADPH)